MNVPFSVSQAGSVCDALAMCLKSRVVAFAFSDDDIAALRNLFETAKAAHEVACEDVGVEPRHKYCRSD